MREWELYVKLVAFERSDSQWIGASASGEITPLAEIDEFYQGSGRPVTRAGRDENERLAVGSATKVLPIPVSGRIFCVGVNFAPHALEGKREISEVPNIFGRWHSSLTVDGATIHPPAPECGLDWEGELACVVGKDVLNADVGEAQRSILGYTCFNDVTARRLQRAAGAGGQWTLGKNGDETGALGPWIVTEDEFGLLDGKRIRTAVNGEIMQDELLSNMVFGPAEVISYISGALRLLSGDVICLGTPGGVGYAREVPRFLTSGDVVSVEIDGIGRLENVIGKVKTAKRGMQ